MKYISGICMLFITTIVLAYWSKLALILMYGTGFQYYAGAVLLVVGIVLYVLWLYYWFAHLSKYL